MGGFADIDVCSALRQQAGPFLLLQNCLLLTSDDNVIAPLALLPLLGDDEKKTEQKTIKSSTKNL